MKYDIGETKIKEATNPRSHLLRYLRAAMMGESKAMERCLDVSWERMKHWVDY